MFYHDHAWGITRLNVYAGEAAGYLITDATEKKLISQRYSFPADQIPLIIQDRTFVPACRPAVPRRTRPGTTARWGGEGNLWYHHVYMPAQNPGDPSGMSAYGRWMYGPWFWPPATTATYGPIPTRITTWTRRRTSPRLGEPATWTTQPPGSTRPTRSASRR